MNAPRIAQLLRELADELERDQVEELPKPPRARRGPRAVVRPPGETDEFTAARARQILKRAGRYAGATR